MECLQVAQLMRMKTGKPSKPRNLALTLKMKGPVAIKSVSISADGHVTFFDHNGVSVTPETVTVSHSYDRPKGPKVLSVVPLSSTPPFHIDANVALLGYDTIYALDANTKRVGDQEVSVAGLFLGKWSQRAPEPRLSIGPMAAIEYHNCEVHPDIFALNCLLKQLAEDDFRLAAGRIAVIVDSHLGQLPKIVAREIPLIDDIYLPDWLDLIYASDAASDALVNKMLLYSDRLANSVLKTIEARASQPGASIDKAPQPGSIRIWSAPKGWLF